MVDHVAEVVFGLFRIRVLLDEIVLVGQLQDHGEEAEKGQDNVGVQSALERLNLVEVCFEEVGLVVVSASEVVCEFGNVVNLNVVLDVGTESAARSAPAVVVAFFVVAFILFLFRCGEFEKVLGQCELPVDLLLGETVVLHVELVTC